MLYKKIMLDIKDRIDSNEFRVGSNLPTEKELIDHYRVSRITIRKAISELVKVGIVETRQGSGTIVLTKTMRSSMSTLRSTSEYTLEAGSAVEYHLAHFQIVEADADVADNLAIAEGGKVYFIRRHKSINGVVCIYEDSYLPVSMFPQLSIPALQGSKYQYFEDILGLNIDGAMQEFEAILPDEDVCKVLNLDPTKPAIRLLSVGRLTDQRPFEFTKLYFRTDTYSFKHYLQRDRQKHPVE